MFEPSDTQPKWPIHVLFPETESTGLNIELEKSTDILYCDKLIP